MFKHGQTQSLHSRRSGLKRSFLGRKKQLARLLQFFHVVGLATRTSFLRIFQKEGLLQAVIQTWKNGMSLLSILRSLNQSPLQSELKPIYVARLKTCWRCPVYNRKLRSCGSKNAIIDGEPAGCLCWMPLKAGTKSDCWAYENAKMFGWPPQLNFSYYET